MKTLVIAACVCLLLFVRPAGAQDEATMPQPAKEHAILKKLTGEWNTFGESMGMEGQPAMKVEGTMSSRMLGEFWVVSEMDAEMMGANFTALQTLGFDPSTKKFTGTWVDSMQGHCWHYTGTVDDSGKKLTLEAEGPDFSDPNKSRQYRDAYEFKSPDLIEMTSSMQGDDGEWVAFMKGKFERKR